MGCQKLLYCRTRELCVPCVEKLTRGRDQMRSSPAANDEPCGLES